MKKRIFFYTFPITFLLIFAPISLFSEDTVTQQVTMQVSEICLVGVSGNPQKLVIAGSENGGVDPLPSTDESTYVQYTSTVAAGVTRTLSIRWGDVDLAPAGCSLKLQAIPAGGANQGVSTGELTLSSSPQTLITNIGSCATGTGSMQGARLIYNLVVDDETQLIAGEAKSVTITLTLTDVS